MRETLIIADTRPCPLRTGHTCFRYYQNGQSILSCNMAPNQDDTDSESVSDLQTKLSDLQTKVTADLT